MLRPVQITVIGSGAIGGTVGAHLVRSGHDVLFCDTDEAHVAAINAHGLRIEGPVEAFTVPARAVLPQDLPPVIDRAVLAVKSHHTAAAAELLRDRLADDGYVLSLQNGLTAEAISAAVGPGRVLVGFVNFGADYLEPGVVLQGNVAAFRVGEPEGLVTDRVREIVAALPWAEATDNITGYLWAKEAYGAMLFATAVSDLSIADALGDPRYRPLMIALAREVLAQAPVPPEPFDGFDPADLEGSLDRLVTFNRASAKTHSGIYRDLMVRHRKTEVDDLLDGLTGPLTAYVGQLIRAIERGERTCEVANLDLLAAYERLERVGRSLHAVVHGLPAPLRAPTGPLHGVPVAVKDMIDVAGIPRGNGNPRAMAGPPATADATVVSRLRDAGGDVFAASSLLEYAAGAPHPDLPEARNPVDPTRTAGGSSGGSAALVGAGVCPAALGTDTGGSIRIPAAYCGVVGLKPSHGVVPVDGVQPLSPTLDHVGVIACDVATTARVFSAISGVTPAPEPAALRVGLLVGQLTDGRVAPAVRETLADAVALLREAGVVLVERDGAPLGRLHDAFEPIVLHEAWEQLGSLMDEDPDHFGPDTARLLKAGRATDPAAYQRALTLRREHLGEAEAVVDGVDVLLGPVVAFTAPIGTPVLDSPEGELESVFTETANLTGQPAITLPCGRDGDGLPVGLQLTGRRGHDADLLAAAAVVERVLDGGGA
jgi:2-dehydropantoate 2-reductase